MFCGAASLLITDHNNDKTNQLYRMNFGRKSLSNKTNSSMTLPSTKTIENDKREERKSNQIMKSPACTIIGWLMIVAIVSVVQSSKNLQQFLIAQNQKQFLSLERALNYSNESESGEEEEEENVYLHQDDAVSARRMDEMITYGHNIARAYPKWTDRPNVDYGNFSKSSRSDYDWCIPQTVSYVRPRALSGKDITGIIFTKSPKSASSTGAGVTLQISENVAKRIYGPQSPPCASNVTHPFAFFRGHSRRVYPSFSWTVVRSPHKREISAFFQFLVMRGGVAPTFFNITKNLDSWKNNQIKYIHGSRKGGLSLKQQQQELYSHVSNFIQTNIINSYDFVAIADRMDESLVVLKLLLNLHDEDIVVASSMMAGSYDGGIANHPCGLLPKPTISSEVNEYLKTNFTFNNFDYMLVAAANRSLDMTIDLLGRDFVKSEVSKYQSMKKYANDQCQNEIHFPCSRNGTAQVELSAQNCYQPYVGCGHECIQRVLKGGYAYS